MSVISSIGTAVKKFSGKPLGVASKALGVATVASVIYDAHINGREKAYATDSIETGDRYYNQYKQFMTMDKESATIAKFKRWWYDMQQSFPLYHLGSKIKGYVSGFGKTLVEGLPLIGLSVVALKFKNVGKVAGVLLGAVGAKTLLHDVVGIGRDKEKLKY